MLDIGWTEVLILAVIVLFVIGPKEIPRVLGFVGKMVAKFRSISRELQESVDEAIQQTELEDIKKEITTINNDISNDINHTLAFTNSIDLDKSSKQNIDSLNKNTKNKQNKNNSSLNRKPNDNNLNIDNVTTKDINIDKEEVLPVGLKHVKTDSSKDVLENSLEASSKKKDK